MKLTMRSLFLKIFLWFWATVIATGIALILTFILEPGSVPSRWHATLVDTARYSGVIAVEEAERGGAPAASAYIERIERETRLRACLFDSAGGLIAGSDCGSFQNMTSHVTISNPSAFSMRYGIARVALMLQGSSGRDYGFATELPAGRGARSGTRRKGRRPCLGSHGEEHRTPQRNDRASAHGRQARHVRPASADDASEPDRNCVTDRPRCRLRIA